MFLLKDLPSEAIFKKFKEEYPELHVPSTRLFLSLLRVGSDLLSTLDEFLARYDLTHGRWITLILLNREPNKKALPSVLAEKQGITRATMSTLLGKLERDGLVERIGCDQDGRSVHIELSKKGQKLLDKIMPSYYKTVRTIFAGFPEAELGKVSIFLERLMEKQANESEH